MPSSLHQKLALQLAAASTHVALSDWQWQAFGFRGRPRRGAFASRFVRPRRRAQELFLLREFSIAAIAVGLVALGEARPDADTVSIGDSAVTQLATAEGVPRALGFASPDELAEYFRAGLKEYRHSADSLGNAFFRRARATPVSIFCGSWLVAIGRIFGEPGAPLFVIAEEFRRS